MEDQAGRVQSVKADKKLDEKKQDIKDSWFDSGMELLSGKPYVSRSALVRYLVDRKGKTRSTAEAYVKPKNDAGMVCKLIEKGVILEHGHGYIVIDDNLSSIMLILKTEK